MLSQEFGVPVQFPDAAETPAGDSGLMMLGTGKHPENTTV
jgi:hypothetical protein